MVVKIATSILLPISIGSDYFRTGRYSEVLRCVPGNYDRVIFFVADRLQLYNRALTSGVGLGETIRLFFSGNDYLRERIQWIRKLGKSTNLDWIMSARILGIDDISDLSFTRILRNVHLLFACDESFREDVQHWALSYVEALNIPTGFEVDLRTRLSTEFVLEEIACNVRLRVGLQIDDELYPGEFPIALPNLYRQGRYSATAEDLAMVHHSARRYRFFTARNAEEARRVFSGRHGDA